MGVIYRTAEVRDALIKREVERGAQVSFIRNVMAFI